MVQPAYEVVVIGSGPGGIAAGVKLKRAGIENFAILERASWMGGTWRDNTYPGASVDLPALLYQFSFARSPRWSRLFPHHDEVQAYHETVARKYGLIEKMVFGTEVIQELWDESKHQWRLRISDGREITTRFLMTAIGAFINPKDPPIGGIGDFRGKLMRPASWDHGYDYSGKRVGVVGTGASAVQLVPGMASKGVGELVVFQRTPAWVWIRPDIPLAKVRWLLRLPGVMALVHRIGLVAMDAVQSGLSYAPQSAIVPLTGGLDAGGTWVYRHLYMRLFGPKDPRLRELLSPKYGPVAKRPTFNSDYLKTFDRPNVRLIPQAVEAITERGVRTADGVEHEFDMIVLATGHDLFCEAESYPIGAIVGRDGADLAKLFRENGLQAYDAVSVPKFPNRFFVVGPYAWSGTGWHDLVETGATHGVRAIAAARERGATLVEVGEQPHQAYHAKVKRLMRGVEYYFNVRNKDVSTYYRNSQGDMPYIRPGSVHYARWRAKHFPLRDYRFERLAVRADAVPTAEYHVTAS
ncbi:NAD(P)/FAD-dependent oxidoreductase [Nocardia uniformis]|uniref:NAD(P)/FAD-dependent oxidoreductase n=1 Tax=Nocardia uniformis TaxID=53432 RepID=A0A849C7U4_9NOCA|nr:NAD(P)/FAD-dependent oxidoreductase [Nocardia uniformis]